MRREAPSTSAAGRTDAAIGDYDAFVRLAPGTEHESAVPAIRQRLRALGADGELVTPPLAVRASALRRQRPSLRQRPSSSDASGARGYSGASGYPMEAWICSR